ADWSRECDRQRKYDLAEIAARKAIDLEPDSAAAHRTLGNALYHQGKFKEAVASHREATRLAPTDAWSHHYLGRALQANGQLDEAIAAYRRALELQPEHPQARKQLDALRLQKSTSGNK